MKSGLVDGGRLGEVQCVIQRVANGQRGGSETRGVPDNTGDECSDNCPGRDDL